MSDKRERVCERECVRETTERERETGELQENRRGGRWAGPEEAGPERMSGFEVKILFARPDQTAGDRGKARLSAR